MRTRTEIVREGECVGPVDWAHPTASDKGELWREAEADPGQFLIDQGICGFEIVWIGMYDGWPYWEPRPAICYIGPLRSPEFAFFDSYGIGPQSIIRKPCGWKPWGSVEKAKVEVHGYMQHAIARAGFKALQGEGEAPVAITQEQRE